jgi:hypothetical protein
LTNFNSEWFDRFEQVFYSYSIWQISKTLSSISVVLISCTSLSFWSLPKQEHFSTLHSLRTPLVSRHIINDLIALRSFFRLISYLTQHQTGENLCNIKLMRNSTAKTIHTSIQRTRRPEITEYKMFTLRSNRSKKKKIKKSPLPDQSK